jgi:SAM-dependent methyltransferase
VRHPGTIADPVPGGNCTTQEGQVRALYFGGPPAARVNFNDHFSHDSTKYAEFRPSYPPEMIRWIAELAPHRSTAWDCATGNGQAAVQLAAHFERVVATDASAEQLRAATPHTRVQYLIANERAPHIGDATIDLVTVAQALHWLDLPLFYAEADRVLVDGGVLAVWCYRRPRIDAETDAVIDWFHDEYVGLYWPANRRIVDDGYRTVAFPYPERATGTWTIERAMHRSAFIGYVETWSAVHRARQRGADPMTEFARRLGEAWPNDTESRTVSWPMSLRAGHRPGRTLSG